MKNLLLISQNQKGLNTPAINTKTGFAATVMATTLPAGPNVTNAMTYDSTLQACALNT